MKLFDENERYTDDGAKFFEAMTNHLRGILDSYGKDCGCSTIELEKIMFDAISHECTMFRVQRTIEQMNEK